MAKVDTIGFVAEAVGIVLIIDGLIPAVHVVAQFVRAGRRQMPGAMTGRLVVTGFNRYVRNPIYLAAMTIIVGEALRFGQLSRLLYTIAVRVGAAAFVRWYEEPALAARFGATTRSAWRPGLHPWTHRIGSTGGVFRGRNPLPCGPPPNHAAPFPGAWVGA